MYWSFLTICKESFSDNVWISDDYRSFSRGDWTSFFDMSLLPVNMKKTCYSLYQTILVHIFFVYTSIIILYLCISCLSAIAFYLVCVSYFHIHSFFWSFILIYFSVREVTISWQVVFESGEGASHRRPFFMQTWSNWNTKAVLRRFACFVGCVHG